MRCKHCKEKFEKKFFNQKFCSKDECLDAQAKYAVELLKKKKKKDWNAKKRKIKKSLEGKSYWEKKLEKVFNEYIRLRDKTKPCISCGAPAGRFTITAGHYFPAGSYKNIRFDEDNVHGQCWYNCNKNKHGNLAEYKIGLIKRIGQERFNQLEEKRLIKRHFTIPELKELIAYYKLKIKEVSLDK